MKILKIDTCDECIGFRTNCGEYECSYTDRKLIEQEDIPFFPPPKECPLKDAEDYYIINKTELNKFYGRE